MVLGCASCTVWHHSGTGVAVYEQKAATAVLAVVVHSSSGVAVELTVGHFSGTGIMVDKQ